MATTRVNSTDLFTNKQINHVASLRRTHADTFCNLHETIAHDGGSKIFTIERKRRVLSVLLENVAVKPHWEATVNRHGGHPFLRKNNPQFEPKQRRLSWMREFDQRQSLSESNTRVTVSNQANLEETRLVIENRQALLGCSSAKNNTTDRNKVFSDSSEPINVRSLWHLWISLRSRRFQHE